MLLAKDDNLFPHLPHIHRSPLRGHSHQVDTQFADWGELRMTQLRRVLQRELLHLSLHYLLILYL